MRQNIVIERIIELLVFITSTQKAGDTSWKLATQYVLLICIAINHYCQVLISFVNQNKAESSTSSGFIGMSGGPGQYCCVPECGSARYGKFGNKPHIGLFKFPSKDKKPQNYQSWVKAISMYRRRGGGDTFDPSSKNTVICEYHFKEEHLRKAAGSTRKRTRKMLSLFKFISLTRPNDKPISKRPAPKQRLALNYVASDSSDRSESCAAVNFTAELLSIEKAIQTDLDQNHLENELNDLTVKKLDLYLFSFSNISKDEKHFPATTGLDVSKFMYLLELLEPGQNNRKKHVNNRKHVVKILTVSSVVRNQNLTLRMNYLWP